MHVTVLAAGSRGDIQPYLALAVGLQQAGHQVRFAANSNFASMVGRYGLTFFPLGFDSYAFVQEPKAQSWLAASSPLKLAITSLRFVRPMLNRLLRDCWQACQNTEAIIYHNFTLPNAYLIGRQLGLPCLPASMYPMPTRAHPALPLNLPNRFGPRLNWLSHQLVDQFTWLGYRAAARKAWPQVGSIAWRPPYYRQKLQHQPIVCCYSPAVLPLPADLPDHVHVTGYWPLAPDPGWQPDPAPVRFLEAGPPPVYIGFGSMSSPAEAGQATKTVLEALAMTGQRGLLASGWGGLSRCPEALPESVFMVDSAPHGWLFGQMAAVVHHGGVGTTGAGLTAGVPTVVVPHFADQYFWGRQVHRLGAGPPPIPRRQLAAGPLALAIDRAVNDQTMRQRAAELARHIAADGGVAQAIDLFEAYVASYGN